MDQYFKLFRSIPFLYGYTVSNRPKPDMAVKERKDQAYFVLHVNE